MFTGIVEEVAEVVAIEKKGTNHTFWIKSSLTPELKIDQSINHNGVCLTIEEVKDDRYRITAIDETLQKTNLSHWSEGYKVNLERAMAANGRFDGHIVQGHVDGLVSVSEIENKEGSWQYDFISKSSILLVEKGSITLNGVSLTVFNVSEKAFSVAIIPYTYQHTTFQNLKEGDDVNVEFDILGKYVQRIHKLQK